MTDLQGLSLNLGDFPKRTIQTLSGSKPFQNSLDVYFFLSFSLGMPKFMS